MLSKLRNVSSTSIYSFILAASLFVAGTLLAFPDQERLPGSPSTLTEPPLNIISDQPDALALTSDNRYLFAATNNQIQRIDLASWSLSTDQIPALSGTTDIEGDPDEGGNVLGLAIHGNEIFAAQDDGDLLAFNLNDLSQSPRLTKISTGELGQMVADPEGFQDEDRLYIADKANKQVHIYDISEDSILATLDLESNLGAEVEPLDLAFAAVPGGTDKVYVSTREGILFSILESDNSLTRIESEDTDGNDLVSLAATPNGNLLFFIDQTESIIHVLDTTDDTEVVVSPVGTTPVPIDLSTINASPRDIVITNVNNPSGTYAYVAGPSGLTLLDLNIIAGDLVSVNIIGTNDDDDKFDRDSTNDDPLPIGEGSSPQQLIAVDDQWILSFNGDAKISVISELPFVTITANSLDGGTLGPGESFTLTFQSDTSGTYVVRLNGDLSGNGTELDSGTVPDANTDVTTNSITQSSDFNEGDNEIFVFVNDSSGNTGHDMDIVKVDTPPPAVVLNSTGFGNESVFINFNRLDISDMDKYNLYAAFTASEALSKTTIDGTVSQPSSGSTVEGKISGLVNGTTYFIAVEAVDEAGNVGPRNGTLDNGVTASAIPQETIGLVEASGETGCQLRPGDHLKPNHSVWLFLLALGIMLFFRQLKKSLLVGFVLMGFFLSSPAEAKEASPQWWSLETKFGFFLPTDDTTESFLTKCCNLRFEIEFGFLYDSKYGIEIGAGFMTVNRNAIGAVTGAQSQDRFNFTTIPLQNNFTFRADFKEDQWVVPYVKFGPDYVIFRQNVQGKVTTGVKYGLHGTAGVQFLLEFGDEDKDMMEIGVNDVYFTIEGEYAWINNFGGSGLDLSGFNFNAGFLFEF